MRGVGAPASRSFAKPVRQQARQVPAGPAGQQTIRRQNLGLVMQAVMEDGPSSRASIASTVGLTRSTVSSLVEELLSRGLLSDRGQQASGSVGRPGRLVGLSDRTVGLGLEINVDYLAASVLDLSGGVRFEQFVRHENRGMPIEVVLDKLGDLARTALTAVEQHGLMSVGTAIAVPGLVDAETGTLLTAPNLGWSDTQIGREMARRLGRPNQYLSVQNEANLAAQGELWEGNGRRWGDFVLVSGEIGVGGAVVVEGELLMSGAGMSGELGHLSVDPEGPACPCGSRGCLERIVGQEALLAAAHLDAEVGTSIGLPDGGVQALVERAEAGDPMTVAALERAARVLGQACASVANLVAPNTIVLGGIYAPLFPWLADPFRAEFECRSFVARYSGVAVVQSELGPAAAVRGAASLTLRAVCADPQLVDAVAGSG